MSNKFFIYSTADNCRPFFFHPLNMLKQLTHAFSVQVTARHRDIFVLDSRVFCSLLNVS